MIDCIAPRVGYYEKQLLERSNWSRMLGFSLPVNRPAGRALIIGSAACRASVVGLLSQLGYQATEVDDPYAGMAEICRKPLAYRAVILCLASLYREELLIVAAIKRRYSHVEVWLAQVDGRAAALAEASRLGADGLLAEDGLHRFAAANDDAQPEASPVRPPASKPAPVAAPDPAPTPMAKGERIEGPWVDVPVGEPVLTADELRALLQEPPLRQPGDGLE
jgi:hypothetical protein